MNVQSGQSPQALADSLSTHDSRVATTGAIPRATYRLQLHKDFTLDAAAAVVPYLASLGISHVYTSPILAARPGSMHGYDIVDHGAINPELGGKPALLRLVAAIRAHGMGLIIDIVPNHMSVGGSDNAWWLDVLEWGRASLYAEFFDIDWEPTDAAFVGRIQAPFLGAAYGTCLQAGDIRLRFDAATGSLAAVYGEHVFPLTPRTYRAVLGSLPPELTPSAPSQGGRSSARASAAAMKAGLRDFAGREGGSAAIERALQAFDPTTPAGQQRLHALLERQHYRLSWWRAASDEINWRRFFDIISLAGIRVELPVVFDATHALILQLYAEGLIDGVRIDHIDGLADPRSYCRKLRRRMDNLTAQRPADALPGPPYIVVEKILAPHERLATDWMIDGSTGYDFMDQVSRLLHDPAGEQPLSVLWAELTGSDENYEDEERAARRLILRDSLASELNNAAVALHRVARRDPVTRDYTLTAIRRALVEILVHFPVYRLYAGLAGRSKTDDRVLEWAMAGAQRNMRAADHPLLEQIGLWLGGQAPRSLPAGPLRRERLRAIVRFEQLSSPVAAKSMEDTAFYRYGRLLSRNEVGANPAQWSLAPSAFHTMAMERRRWLPNAMLATATHDHKRGEDLRARLAVLSEMPGEWAWQLNRWMRLNAPLRREFADVMAPDPGDEIMLYQMLVGAWPQNLTPDDADGLEVFARRIIGWQEKALREAKRHSEWVAPNEAYEAACRNFVYAVLDTTRASRVVQEIAIFADRIAPAGDINALSQTLLRLTVPGVPDLYQGAELWDLSLVDPDNRRPVDFAMREAMLAALSENSSPEAGDESWWSGQVKLQIIARALGLRTRNPGLFANGRYVRLMVEGDRAEHVLAFARQTRHGAALIAVTRLPMALLAEGEAKIRADTWGNTHVVLPRDLAGRRWRDVLGKTHLQSGGRIKVSGLFSNLPVALLDRE